MSNDAITAISGDDLLHPTQAQPSQVLRPRGVVLVNDKPVHFWSFEVEQRSHFASDIWRFEMSTWQNPEKLNLDYWADATGVMVEIKIGFLLQNQGVDADPATQISLILGQVDDIEPDPLTGVTTISGRDLSARLIDTKTSDKWPDKTSSEIITIIAGEQQLDAVVKNTKTPVGQYYNDSYTQVNRSISEWELAVFLAQKEGFDLYVKDSTIHFEPPEDDKEPFQLSVKRNQKGVVSNVEDLKLHRSLTLAQDINISVLSHDYWEDKQVKGTASRNGKKFGSATTRVPAYTKQNYVIRRPGMTDAQATQLAQNLLAEISKFEKTLTFNCAGQPLMRPHSRKVQLQGTNSSFDQKYFVDKVTHKFDFQHGYTMDVHCKNIPPTLEGGS